MVVRTLQFKLQLRNAPDPTHKNQLFLALFEAEAVRLLSHPVHLRVWRSGLEFLVEVINQTLNYMAILGIALAAIACMIILTIELNGFVLFTRQVAFE